ncbi:hypothetical protein Fmac_025019 [Flemingia macrophylla]|uniref:Secreted protein n=1 Tax=Flemingia macrophylla TaxID=520843 RepID=A0ABD1LR21_9FABA
MEGRVGLLFLILLSVAWAYDAGGLVNFRRHTRSLHLATRSSEAESNALGGGVVPAKILRCSNVPQLGKGVEPRVVLRRLSARQGCRAEGGAVETPLGSVEVSSRGWKCEPRVVTRSPIYNPPSERIRRVPLVTKCVGDYGREHQGRRYILSRGQPQERNPENNVEAEGSSLVEGNLKRETLRVKPRLRVHPKSKGTARRKPWE